jgi:hypothetical protein
MGTERHTIAGYGILLRSRDYTGLFNKMISISNSSGENKSEFQVKNKTVNIGWVVSTNQDFLFLFIASSRTKVSNWGPLGNIIKTPTSEDIGDMELFIEYLRESNFIGGSHIIPELNMLYYSE